MKFLFRKSFGAFVEVGDTEIFFLELLDGAIKMFYRRLIEELGGFGSQSFENAAGTESDDGGAGRERLERCNPEVFDAWEDQRAGAGEVMDHAFARNVAEEFDVGFGHFAEPFFLLARADDLELAPAGIERLDREVCPFVRGKGGDHQIKIVFLWIRRLARAEVFDVDERVNHRGVLVVVLANALGDECRIRDHEVDVPVGLDIPTGQAVAKKRHERALQKGRFGPEVDVVLVVQVAHGAVDVRDVRSLLKFRLGDAFDDAMTAGDYKICVGRNFQGFGRLGENRQEFAVLRVNSGDRIQERGADAVFFDSGRGRSRLVNQRVDLRLREKLTEGLEHTLAAAESHEPVMEEGDFHGLFIPKRNDHVFLQFFAAQEREHVFQGSRDHSAIR